MYHNSFPQPVPDGYFSPTFRVYEGRLPMELHQQVSSNEINHMSNGSVQPNIGFANEDLYYSRQQFAHKMSQMSQISSVGSFEHEYTSEGSHRSVSPQQRIQPQQTNMSLPLNNNTSAYSASGVLQNSTPPSPSSSTPPQYPSTGVQPFLRGYPLTQDMSQHEHTQQHIPPNSRSGAARSPYEWIRRPTYQNQPNPGKTRTKDKYRVVYTDHQRLQLEKEYSLNTRYINIKRKAEIALELNLSERQVKIWFQNRRAKDRKLEKKQKEEQSRAMQSQPDREVPDGAGALREVSFNIALLNESGLHSNTF